MPSSVVDIAPPFFGLEEWKQQRYDGRNGARVRSLEQWSDFRVDFCRLEGVQVPTQLEGVQVPSYLSPSHDSLLALTGSSGVGACTTNRTTSRTTSLE